MTGAVSMLIGQRTAEATPLLTATLATVGAQVNESVERQAITAGKDPLQTRTALA